MSYKYEYARPAFTADIILFRYSHGQLQILLIKRKYEPFQGCWAFPGGFVDENETALNAAYRELLEETEIANVELKTLFTNSEINRDPRGWTISEVFYSFVNESVEAFANDDAKEVKWFEVGQMPDLAFDHQMIYKRSINKLEELLRFKVWGLEFLPVSFSLDEICYLYEYILKDKSLVRKIIQRAISFELIINKGTDQLSFDKKKYNQVLQNGFI